jgi:hypothetical protein
MTGATDRIKKKKAHVLMSSGKKSSGGNKI